MLISWSQNNVLESPIRSPSLAQRAVFRIIRGGFLTARNAPSRLRTAEFTALGMHNVYLQPRVSIFFLILLSFFPSLEHSEGVLLRKAIQSGIHLQDRFRWRDECFVTYLYDWRRCSAKTSGRLPKGKRHLAYLNFFNTRRRVAIPRHATISGLPGRNAGDSR